MATRNLTSRFENFRTQLRPARREYDYSLSDHDESNQTTLLGSQNHGVNMALGHSLPPEWVDIVEDIQKNIGDITKNLKKLDKMHKERLKVTFGPDETKQEQEIEILTQEITRLFHKSENGLKCIATIGNDRGANLPTKERVVRLNVMRSLAAEIQGLSKEFRQNQREFVYGLKGQEDFGSDLDGTGKNSISIADVIDRGMTQENVMQLQEIERSASEREKEIIRIAQSINELTQLFRELNVLVIEQGTILDRIDYNVEQVLVKVKAGNVELKKADDYSKKAKSVVCIIVLFFICVILLSILIYKHTDHSDDSGDKKE